MILVMVLHCSDYLADLEVFDMEMLAAAETKSYLP